MSGMEIATWGMIVASLIMNTLTFRNIMRTRRYTKRIQAATARMNAANQRMDRINQERR